MSQYLKHKGTGHLYAYTEQLAQRDDFVKVEVPCPEEKKKEPTATQPKSTPRKK